MKKFRIAASILSADFSRLAEEVRAAEEAGADWIHVDVMDGHFVPNLTIGPDVVAAISEVTSLPVDVHLMIERPDAMIDRFVEAGADALGVHVEACPHLHRTLEHIAARGARTCVALNPGTPAAALAEVLPQLDQILVMTVNPGFGGQSFIAGVMPKLRELRRSVDLSEREIDIVVDGGVSLETVEQAAIHGGRIFVTGSAFFKSGDYKRFVDGIQARLAPYSAGP